MYTDWNFLTPPQGKVLSILEISSIKMRFLFNLIYFCKRDLILMIYIYILFCQILGG